MVSVYVSYAWNEERQNRLVDKLAEACAKRGIELVRDTGRIGYGDSIRKFMDELSAAEHIVLVLSNSYFRSDSCMYELRGIYRHRHFRDFRARVHPVVLAGTHLHKPGDRIAFIKHWIAEEEKLEQALNGLRDPKHTLELRRSLEDYADFHRLMDQLTSILADMNALTEDVHLGSDFAALLERIAPDEFRQTIAGEVREILARDARLGGALGSRLPASGGTPAGDLAAALCALPPEQAIGEVLFPATRACLAALAAASSGGFTDIWNSAKSLLAWLTLLAVDSRSLAGGARKALAAGRLAFEICVSTPLGVEIVSSRSREMAPRLRIDKSGVVGEGAIGVPVGESGWDEDAAFENLLLEVWRCVFPEESRAQLSAADRRILGATLRVRREQKTFHHYIALPGGESTALASPGLITRLVAELPDLAVIVFHDDAGTPALLVSDEYYFMSLMREFLTIPEVLAKKR
ncbi:toll/interleukin-1 receptor domain-containing protein [Accumulibacter sp.]|uniref:toll/interleukin-1 receptor domain-containing protein n=1 Tax=Accumulibacter sp. TaxID=2053492 RepID=UPI0025F9EE77|nr:toll/interleukin-1 receptor domain-containing protein [Accumulibacter sp.]MCM8595747.1 toll/interleukin-1 receptor domain-containing protein [Accumulibacter sp.]MCM8626596.1 toll/interleukin-1 receptor domain-containing protein [Accumulibacter sp.]MDS4049895.1 toll/interleukin-1 receptor domain-containing protein [Accumulibacter sp.]